MEIFGLRLHIVILVLIITAVLLLGSTHLYRKYRVDEALRTAYGEDSAVLDVEVTHSSGQTKLSITTAEVENLQELYERLCETAQSKLDPRRFELVIKDKRNERLSRAYDDLQFCVLEAAATGRFSILEEKPAELAASWDLSRVHITADTNFIYVQLHDGAHYLYELVPRQDLPREGDSGST